MLGAELLGQFPVTLNPDNDHESRLVVYSGGNLNPIRIVSQRLSRREVKAMLLSRCIAWFALSMIVVMRSTLSYPDCAVHNLVN